MRPFLLISILLIAVIGVQAQGVAGTVVDPNGEAIPNARLTVTDGGRTIERTTTNAAGEFTLSSDSRGKTLRVRYPGFDDAVMAVPLTVADIFVVALSVAPITATTGGGEANVTITRTETTLSETPASIAVIGRERIDETAALSTDDMLRQVPGFTLFRRSGSRTTNPTAQGANLRGVSGSGASRTSVLYDGLSLNDAFGGWTYWSRVPRVAIDRAEVLRGGASSIYGSGGLSGAVDLVPVMFAENKSVLRIETSAGTQATGDLGLYAGISRGKWSFDSAGEAFRTGGYIPVAEDQRGSVDTPANSKHSNIIAGVERRFDYSPQRRRDAEKAVQGRIFARANLFSEDRENGTMLTTNGTYFRQLAAGADVSGQRVGRFEFRSFVQTQVYDQTFSAVSVDRNTETLTRLQRVPSQAAGASLFWTQVVGQHTLAASTEYREVRGSSDEIGYFAGVATQQSGGGGRERTIAFLAQDVVRIGERMTVNAGIRFDRWQNYQAATTVRSLATGSVSVIEFPDRTLSAFSPRIGLNVRVLDHVSVYGSYSRSFRAPTLNELYRDFRVGNISTLANSGLLAETADTVEGGISTSAFDRRLSLRANVFSTSVSDPVVSVTLAATPTLITRQRQNVGRTTARGIEFDAEFSPHRNLRLTGGYLFAVSQVAEFPADPTLVGNSLPQTARHNATFQAAYTSGSFTFAIQGRGSSSQFEDDRNTLRLRLYFTLDASAAYRFNDRVSAFAAAENILNSRYDIGLTPVRTVAAPAFVRVGLRMKVGKR